MLLSLMYIMYTHILRSVSRGFQHAHVPYARSEILGNVYPCRRLRHKHSQWTIQKRLNGRMEGSFRELCGKIVQRD